MVFSHAHHSPRFIIAYTTTPLPYPSTPLLTKGSTLMLIAPIMAVIHAVTAEEIGHTLAIVAGKREAATLLSGWLTDGIAFTRPLIALKLHPIGAAAHPLEVGCWVAEVAAVPVGMGGLVAVVRP